MKEYNATTGAALPDDSAANPQFAQIPLEAITPSLTNRTHFDADKMAELAASIAASGVHQPILVRPLPGDRMLDTGREVRFEIVSGERRYRASLLAKVPTIPAMIRSLTDNQVLEIQIIENLQRENLTALEESEGYERLMATGLSADEIGDKIGKSRRYVYARVQLQHLFPEARTALREGQIDFSRALLIARIPDPTLQIKTNKEFCKTNHEGQPLMSLRECERWVRSHVMLILKDARFGVGDADLVPSAGACTECPKRTGANPDLFADVDGPDMCTDPHCYSTKQEAHSQRTIAEARNKGMRVIEGKEALEIKPNKWGSTIDGYSDLDSKYDMGDGPKPLRDLLDTKALKGKVTLFVDPHDGKPRHLVPDDLVGQLEQKHMSPAEKKADKKKAEKGAKENLAAKELGLKRVYHQRWRKAAIEQIELRVRAGEVRQFEAPVLRALLARLCDICTGDSDGFDVTDLGRALKLTDEDGNFEQGANLAQTASTVPEVDLGPTLLLAVLYNDATVNYAWMDGSSHLIAATPVIDSVASSLDINLDAIRAEVQDQIRTESKAADAPAARPAKGAGGRKAKLTVAEAQAGIADALQGEEGVAA